MKVLSVILSVAVLVVAEPPRYHPRTDYGSPDAQVEAAPYAPSGWRPSGRQFLLPARQGAAPASSYYLPPPQYGPPEAETTEQPTTTTEVPTTTEVTTEEVEQDGSDELADGNNVNGTSQRLEQQRDREELGSGLYYVLLPDGRLQRVAYTTGRDVELSQKLSMAYPQQLTNGYYTELQYHDVEPIRAPIYQYSSAPLVRIFK